VTTATHAHVFAAPARRTAWLREAALVLGGSLLLAASARIWLPLGPVPATAQTLAVLLLAGAMGGRRAAAATLAYVAQGLAGLPVFAGGGAGPVHLLGPTGGYLVGFVAAALVTGELLESGWSSRPGTRVAAMAVGSAVTYAFGAAWLSAFVGAKAALALGVAPFLVGDAVKVVLAAMLAPAGAKLLARLR
jgi:biotin transport system substrate-specific component